MREPAPDDVRVESGGPWERDYGYSRVVRRGDLVMTAGCTATVDGAVLHPGDAGAQATVAFGAALSALAEVGCTASDVVHTRMYVLHREDADVVGRAHAAAMVGSMPAATMVLVAGLVHPDMLVEVELTATRMSP